MGNKCRRRWAVIWVGIAGFVSLGIAQSASAVLTVSVTPSATSVREGETVTYTVSVTDMSPCCPNVATIGYSVTALTDSVFGDTANFCGPFPHPLPGFPNIYPGTPITCSYPEVMTGAAPRSVTNIVTATATQQVSPDIGPLPPPTTVKADSLPATVTVIPLNAFSLGATQYNKKKGTATLNLTLPFPGHLTASGNGVSAASAGRAVISKAVGAGPAKLLIKAMGKKKRS